MWTKLDNFINFKDLIATFRPLEIKLENGANFNDQKMYTSIPYLTEGIQNIALLQRYIYIYTYEMILKNKNNNQIHMRWLIHAKSNIQREFQMDGIFGVINKLDKMITKT